MKIAILTSGFLPLPAVQGGAVENLMDMYLAYNNEHGLHNITIYSASHPAASHHHAVHSEANHYHYITMNSLAARIRKKLHRAIHGREYYHYAIEYYLDRAIAHIQEHDYDMVIVENRPGYILKLSRATQARIVCHLHNDVLNSTTPCARDIVSKVTRIIPVSHFIAQRVSTIGVADKCTVVHNGVDLQLFSPDAPKLSRRSDFSLSAHDFVLVFTGRIIAEKGIAQLIDAMNLLDSHPHIKLLVVGSSFYGNAYRDSEFLTQLKQKAQGLGDRIAFTGYIPYAKLPSILSLADVAVLPSVWDEPLGMTCIEAMAMGVPVVTTRKGGIPETVADDCGILLDADEALPRRLADSILYLHDHPDERLRMGRACRRRASFFSRESFCQHFFEAIENKL